MHPEYPFDLTKLTPVTQVATGPLILVVKNALGIKTLAELIEHAKANPGKLSFGAGGGTGSSLYFATELLKAKTGIKLTIVNYRGAGPALNDLLGGHIDGMFDAMPVMVVQAKEGKVTPLAVTSAKRSPALPNVPTIMESGVPDYEMAGWFGILAPAGTPPAIAQRLRDEVAKAVAAPDVVATLASQGMAPLATQPGEWAQISESRARRLYQDHQGREYQARVGWAIRAFTPSATGYGRLTWSSDPVLVARRAHAVENRETDGVGTARNIGGRNWEPPSGALPTLRTNSE